MPYTLPRHHSEFAPLAIQRLFTDLTELLHFTVYNGGILGDESHTYGYHRARAVLPSDDYSVVLAKDQVGRPWAAAALDVTPEKYMYVTTLTSRLRAGVERGDPRLAPLREFYGTLDGRAVYGWDLAYNRPSSSDQTHLWHLHMSFHRDSVSRPSLMRPIARLLAGR